MGVEYCIYGDKRYFLHKWEERLYITSRINQEGYENYIDIFGDIVDGLYVKYLSEDEVDIIYDEALYIKYLDVYYESFNSYLDKRDVERDSFMIFTESYEVAEQLDFTQREQFVFYKKLKRSEIEAIKVIQTPIKKFSYLAPTETILEGAAIDEWLANLLR